MAFFNTDTESVVRDFESDARSGLSPEQVKRNAERYGTNEFTRTKPKSLFRRIFEAATEPMLILLIFGAVRLHHVESVADFLLQNMAFFFLPAMLGVLEIWNDIKSEALAILAVCLLTTLCTAAATALTVHIVFRLQHRETEEAFDHD